MHFVWRMHSEQNKILCSFFYFCWFNVFFIYFIQGVNFVYIHFSAKDAHIIHSSGSRSGSNDRWVHVILWRKWQVNVYDIVK